MLTIYFLIIYRKSDDDDGETLREWLNRASCDNSSIDLLEKHHYTKRDVIDFVSREELMALGIL